MNPLTMKKLEFDKIIKSLLKECSSSLGQQKVASLYPITDLERIKVWQQETTEGVLLRRYEPQIPLGGISDLTKEMRKLEIGGILEPEELLRLYDALIIARKLKNFLTKKKQYLIPRLEWWANKLYIFKNLEEEIDMVISPEGEVRDSASSKLQAIKIKINTIQDRIKDKLESIVRSERTKKYLQDDIITIRGDRYVVPVKQEYRHKISGLIHDQSASGATLFMEPMSVVNFNNDLKRYKIAEKEEIIRILKELSLKLADYVEEFQDNQEVLGHIDFILAKARLSEKMNGVAPEIVNEQRINIIKGRHPLINANKVVPLTISLGEDFDSLIITGPNTGGKTVTLKTVGLFVLMTQSGLHIPAEVGSCAGIFTKVFADIGDEQSIEQSLSTFSSHMTNIINILNNMDRKSLVLLDELGAGTDPTEGAALAEAILRRIISTGAKVIATTHYGELKSFAFQEERVQNASVEFDIKSLQPTYKLLIGVPGKSNALAIAGKLGLPEDIITIAEGLRTKSEKDISQLIQSLEENKINSEIEKQKSAELLKKATEKFKLAEEELFRIKKKEEKIIRDAEEKALGIVKEAKNESENIVKEIKKISQNEIKNATLKAQELKKNLDVKADHLTKKLMKGPQVIGKTPENIEEGEVVFVPKFNQKGIVISVPNNNKEIQVQIGIIKVNVSLDEVILAERQTETSKSGIGKIVLNKTKNISPELDFRGMRVDEALPFVDKYLDDAFLAGLQQVSLIHGKGEGILRKSVRDFLKIHPKIKSFRTGDFQEGGSGVTIVEFKK